MIGWFRALRSSLRIDSAPIGSYHTMRTPVDRVHAALARGASQPWQEAPAALRGAILSEIDSIAGMPRELRPRRVRSMRPLALAASISLIFGLGVWVGINAPSWSGNWSNTSQTVLAWLPDMPGFLSAEQPANNPAQPEVPVTMIVSAPVEQPDPLAEMRNIEADTRRAAKAVLQSLPIDIDH